MPEAAGNIRWVTLRYANGIVNLWHSHLPPARGHIFSLGAFDGAECVGVVIVSRPVPRMLDDGSVTLVVTWPPYWNLRDYAVPGQIGMEPTPAAFLEALVVVFREVRSVLRRDGTLWVNMGDSYANRQHGASQTIGSSDGRLGRGPRPRPRRSAVGGLKVKDLIGMPW